MLEILEFIFSSFWIYLGFFMLLLVLGAIIVESISNICKTIIKLKVLKQEDYNQRLIDMIDAEIEE